MNPKPQTSAKKTAILLYFCIALISCTDKMQYSATDTPPDIFPDYSDVAIPCNIAPLNFYINDDADKYMVRFLAGKDSFDLHCKNKADIPVKKWKNLLKNNSGETLTIRIFAKNQAEWLKYNDIKLEIVPEPVDPYLVYRLIEPGYQFWGKMGIYQRNMETFDESPVMLNTMMNNNCINCHSFCRNNPHTMLFHIRTSYAGTILVKDGNIMKINTEVPENISSAVYPRWHPDGRHVAFSTNKTTQAFHSANNNLIEVYDTNSDLTVFDAETKTMFSNPSIHAQSRFETFPEWSPDGKSLFFCSAPATKMPDNYDSLKYDLYRIDFDPETGKFGKTTDTILLCSKFGKSVAFPRVSPDGRYLMICLSDYGTFPIWHKENDLYLIDLQTKTLTIPTEINSNESDSYHSWSTNGKWVVFSSRRLDGLYTRPYIVHFDGNGKFGKPFLLPQKNPLFYNDFIKSYNIPEFLTGKIEINIRTFESVAKSSAKNIKSAGYK